jgi:hypothetical protein
MNVERPCKTTRDAVFVAAERRADGPLPTAPGATGYRDCCRAPVPCLSRRRRRFAHVWPARVGDGADYVRRDVEVASSLRAFTADDPSRLARYRTGSPPPPHLWCTRGSGRSPIRLCRPDPS